MIQNRISWSDLPVDFLLLKTEKKILDLINPKPWPIQCFGCKAHQMCQKNY